MNVSLIAAVAQNGTIGKDNDLPWTIRADMRFFVQTTKGHTVITGRKNFEAMGRPLPKRRNIVLSRDAHLTLEGAETATDMAQALRLAHSAGESEVFIIGGAQIYTLAFPFAHRFYRTTVLADVAGDVRFPQLDWSGWSVKELMRHEADAENEHAFVIERLDRQGEPDLTWKTIR